MGTRTHKPRKIRRILPTEVERRRELKQRSRRSIGSRRNRPDTRGSRTGPGDTGRTRPQNCSCLVSEGLRGISLGPVRKRTIDLSAV